VGSASILVARHARVVLHEGFGRLNRSSGAPATQPDTPYIVASISKPVSVCGLMLLVDEGRVALTDRVQRYLPEFQGRLKERVRVGHLLSHTSGLPDMVPENTQLRRSHAPLSRFVEAALRTPLRFEPGTRFSYQSMGTLLAAEIAERVSGMRLRDLLRTRIFRPLGMRRTMLGLQGRKIEETAIFQEDRDTEDSRRWGPNSPYWRTMGHPWGGLHATAGDLAVLLQTFLNGGSYGEERVFSPATAAAMTRDQNGELGAPWGYGWALRDSPVWNYFGDLGTAGTFGHVGITGTVAWADPGRQLICVLLSTRTAAHENGFLLKSISNMVHAAVVGG
jgi:CubicO group peptidase (beta-lactamase class C family)